MIKRCAFPIVNKLRKNSIVYSTSNKHCFSFFLHTHLSVLISIDHCLLIFLLLILEWNLKLIVIIRFLSWHLIEYLSKSKSFVTFYYYDLSTTIEERFSCLLVLDKKKTSTTFMISLDEKNQQNAVLCSDTIKL